MISSVNNLIERSESRTALQEFRKPCALQEFRKPCAILSKQQLAIPTNGNSTTLTIDLVAICDARFNRLTIPRLLFGITLVGRQ